MKLFWVSRIASPGTDDVDWKYAELKVEEVHLDTERVITGHYPY